MPGYQRAYSPEHKAERFADLMETTDRLFRERGFHEVTMTAIAKELGWTRSNLYRYAQSIEEVFLALYRQKHRAFLADLLSSLGDCGFLGASDFARRFAEVADRHHEYLDYQGFLASVIETNVPYEMLAAFKAELINDIETGYRIMMAQCPGLSRDEAGEFYLALIYQACELNGHLHCTENQGEAMKEAGVTFASDGFVPTLARIVAAILTGARTR